MFIRRADIAGFGRLSGICEFPQGKCAVLCQSNEYGKSTLADAILYTLYGFPSAKEKRAGLKPRERCRPWNAGIADNGYSVELQIDGVGAGAYRLRACFSKQQPFELTDLASGKSVSLEGSSFGRKFLGMPLNSFTECFFLRQDEYETDGSRDELLQIIEEAAVSNRHAHDSPVRNALNALSECRLHFEEFSSGPVVPENLLRNIEKRLATSRSSLEELRQQVAQRAGEMAQAQRLDAAIEALKERQVVLEVACLQAEAAEIEDLLRQQESHETIVRQNQQRMTELEAYNRFDPALRSEVQQLYAEWLAAKRRLEEVGSSSATREDPGTKAPASAEHDLVPQPEIDILRSLRLAFQQCKEALASRTSECLRLRDELTNAGVPASELDELCATNETFSISEMKLISTWETQRAGFQSELAEVRQKHSETAARAAAAKANRERLRISYSSSVVGAAILVAIGFLLCLMHGLWGPAVWLGSLSLVGAVGCSAVCFLFVHKIREQSSNELEPALADEISASAEVRRCQEQLETLDSQLNDQLERRQLQTQDIAQLRQLVTWTQLAAPLRAAQDGLNQCRRNLDEVANEICNRVRTVLPSAQPDELELEQIDRVVETISADAQRQQSAASERSEADRVRSETEALGSVLENLAGRLEQLIQVAVPDDLPLDQRIDIFLEGCDHAVRLHTLAESDTGQLQLLPTDRVSELRNRLESITRRLGETLSSRCLALPSDAPGRPRSAFQDELEKLKAEREELRLRRSSAFSECDRVAEMWRREGPRLEAEVERLEDFRREVIEFRDAVLTAHREMSAVADQVYNRWAAALNTALNRLLPIMTPHFSDAEFDEDLELSVYSREAGRRLSSKELLHLSKGARDQLALCVRIAISEYLSAHVGDLPIILDEPFAHWDDERFTHAMEFLVQLAKQRQVIVLSCHNWRYEMLGRTRPEIAEQLHFCTLAPCAPEAGTQVGL